jgi:DNA-directed RNA polymerase subunit RPC12/RpoP
MKTEAMPAKAEFKFNCPNCGQHIMAATEWSGLGISCPSCYNRITIPPPSTQGRFTKRIMSVDSQSQVQRPNPQKGIGKDPWSELVRRLEKGTLVEPAELATALFHELTSVRRRLDRLEKQMLLK